MPDSRTSARRACVLAAACLLGPGAAFSLIYTVDNTISQGVGFSAAAAGSAGCATPVAKTFAVGSGGAVTDIGLGFNMSHAIRGDIRLTLVAPNGTFLQFVAGNSGDPDDNYDVTFSANSEGALDDGDIDPVAAPNYNRLVSVAALGTVFDGVPNGGSGTWTLNICDIANAGTSGTFNSARLVVATNETVAAECSGTSLFDFAINTPGAAMPAAGHKVVGVTIDEASTVDYAARVATRTWLISDPPPAPNWAANEVPQGNDNSFYSMAMDGPAGGDNETYGVGATFSLNPPVKNFQFSLLDVDSQAGGWEDIMPVRGLDSAGGPVPFTMTTSLRNQRAGNLAEGDTPSAGGNTTDGNVTYSFQGDVASLDIEYLQGDDPTTAGSFQIIGIGDFTFCALDFGDAPASYDGSDPPRHAQGAARTLYLGANPPDIETGTQTSATSTLDDTSQVEGTDDEDGVPAFPGAQLTAGGSYTISGIIVNNATGGAATLCGWLDFDINSQAGDGSFQTDERSCITVPASGSNANCTSVGTTFTCSMSWTVPADFVYNASNDTFARFRVASNNAEASSPSGLANRGEVEDYLIPAGTLPVTVAWVDSARNAGGYRVEWITSSETSNVGFRLLGKVPTGFVELDRQASQAVDSSRPLRYEAEFGRRPGVRSVYIEEIDTRGRTRLHGPYRLGRAYGERPVERPIEWARVREQFSAAAAAEKSATASNARLLVRERGIHRLTHEQLLAAGVDLAGSRGADLALLDSGKPVARFVGGPAVWGLGSFVEFLFAPALTLASPYDVLELKLDAKNARAVKQGAGVSGSAPLAVFPSEVSVAFDRAYSFASPTADPWFDERLLSFGGPASLRRLVELPDWVAGDVELRVDYWGVTSWEGTRPDHRVILRFNGARLADDEFDGLTARAPTFAVGGVVTSSLNELEVTVPGTTGFAFDLVHFEGVRAVYQRAAMARGGRLDAVRPSQLGAWSATRFGQREVVAWSGETRWQLTPDDGTVVLPEASDAFFLADVARVASPVVLPGIPERVDSLEADYLIVTHPLFAAELGRLVDLQKSRGLKTQVVTTDAIYARYSDHAPSAEAIQRYIADAKTPPRFALLVGGESYDTYDHLALGSISFVPTSYRRVNEFVAFGPTDEAMADLDGDQVPDLAIGRLPVRTVEELEVVTDKLVEWGRGYSAPQALIVSGRSDESSPIKAVGDRHAAMLTGWKVWRSSVDNLGPAVVRSMVGSSLSYGTTLISFVGHTAFSQWDFQPVLTAEMVQQLPSAWTPTFVAQWGCWNAYFASPEVMTLSTELLLQPGGGAFGVIGSSTLTSVKSHQLLGERFLAYVGAGSKTVGEALLAAKRELGAAGETYRDAILSQVLLGDPATPLPAGKR